MKPVACIINILWSLLTPLVSSVSDAPNFSITYDRNWRHLLRHRLRLRWSTFIVQASFTIVEIYFIIQATGSSSQLKKWLCTYLAFTLFETKLSNLKLKTRRKQILVSLPLNIPLPGNSLKLLMKIHNVGVPYFDGDRSKLFAK